MVTIAIVGIIILAAELPGYLQYLLYLRNRQDKAVWGLAGQPGDGYDQEKANPKACQAGRLYPGPAVSAHWIGAGGIFSYRQTEAFADQYGGNGIDRYSHYSDNVLLSVLKPAKWRP